MTPLIGNWDGDGDDRVGLYLPVNGLGLFLFDMDGDRQWDPAQDSFTLFGLAEGFVLVVGDWNADGTDEIGIYQGASGVFLLDQNGNGAWDDGVGTIAPFGQPGDLPVSGQW